MKVRIATRRSDLALWQANHVAGRLRAAGARTELVQLVTRGDRIDDVPLSKVEGKAFFTAEIELALLEDRADVAVHSHKDLPVDPTPGLALVAVPERASVAERLLVLPAAHDEGAPFLPLKRGARVGTSAPRRGEQLAALRPDLEILDLRGNVPTRVRKLRAGPDGRYDAILLAAAGLDRLELDLDGLRAVELPTDLLVPAPAQGALAIQTRADDAELVELCRRALHDEGVRATIAAERRLLTELGGGCSLPLGASIARDEHDGTWCGRAFLGRDHPRPGCPPRWASAAGADPAAVAEELARRLHAGEATGVGPLGGRRVALAGSESSGATLAERLAILGARVERETVIAFEDLAADLAALVNRLAALRPGDGLAVTSAECARRLAGTGVAPGVRVAAVGPATARALAASGYEVELVGEGGARELAEAWDLAPGARVLFPCAEGARVELEETLAARDVPVERLPLYRTVPLADASLAEDVDARVYLSPSAVAAALAWERERPASRTLRIALGASTARALGGAGLAAATPERPGAEAVVHTLARLLPAGPVAARPSEEVHR